MKPRSAQPVNVIIWLAVIAWITGGARVLAPLQVQALEPQAQTQIGAPSQAQPAPRREFEVASIRPNTGEPRRGTANPFTFLPGGRFTAINVTLVDMIVRVYPTRRIQMQGGPEWIDSDRFDIVAKADEDEGEVKPGQWNEMIQALLEKRFKLVMHRESKEMSAYTLVVGKNPPKIQESKEGEQTDIVNGARGQMNFQRMSLVGLVNTLSNMTHMPIVDGTGMKGSFDFTLDPIQLATPGVPVTRDSYADLVLSAVQEQLGFKLEERKAPLDITIVDHAEMPTDN
jgi:uncharacterized protein (TIGR03435 family)